MSKIREETKQACIVYTDDADCMNITDICYIIRFQAIILNKWSMWICLSTWTGIKTSTIGIVHITYIIKILGECDANDKEAQKNEI